MSNFGLVNCYSDKFNVTPKVMNHLILSRVVEEQFKKFDTESLNSFTFRFNFFPELFDTNRCFPIPIPRDDPFWRGRRTCMEFTRSMAAPSLKCSLEFQQQVSFCFRLKKQTKKNPCLIEF